PHAARQIPADRQAKPGTLPDIGETAVELHERLEHRLQLLRGYPNAIVANVDAHHVAFPRTVERDLTRRARELHRIREEVQDDLAHLVDIALRGQNLVAVAEAEAELLRPELWRDQSLHVSQQHTEGNALTGEAHLRRLEPREVQNVVDQ